MYGGWKFANEVNSSRFEGQEVTDAMELCLCVLLLRTLGELTARTELRYLFDVRVLFWSLSMRLQNIL